MGQKHTETMTGRHRVRQGTEEVKQRDRGTQTEKLRKWDRYIARGTGKGKSDRDRKSEIETETDRQDQVRR